MHCIIVYSTLTIVHVYVRSIVFFFSNLFSFLAHCVHFFFLLCFWFLDKKNLHRAVHLGDITFCVIYWHIQVSPWSHPFFSLSLSDISVSFRLTDTNTLYFGHTHTLADTVTLVSGCRIFVAEEGCWDRVAVRKKGAIGGQYSRRDLTE